MFRSRSGKAVARCLLIGALALLIPAVAGCEAGLNAPTLQFHPASSGAHAVVSKITINDVFVLGAPVGSTLPAGSSAGVFLSLFNGGTSGDALVSMAAPGYASSVSLTGGTVSLPANSPVNLMGPQPMVLLSGLTKPLAGGMDIPVTLNFEHAGSVRLMVPVQPQSFYYSTYSAAPAPATPTAPTATTTPAAKPGATPTP